MDDIHFANKIKTIFSSYCYVHHKSIDVLTKDRRSKLEKWIHDIAYRQIINLIQEIFSQQYNPNTVLQRIVDIINKEPIINYPEIEEWFKEQYLASYPEADSTEALKWMRENVYNQETFEIKPNYVQFFLVNQGVLELDGQNSNE